MAESLRAESVGFRAGFAGTRGGAGVGLGWGDTTEESKNGVGGGSGKSNTSSLKSWEARRSFLSSFISSKIILDVRLLELKLALLEESNETCAYVPSVGGFENEGGGGGGSQGGGGGISHFAASSMTPGME